MQQKKCSNVALCTGNLLIIVLGAPVIVKMNYSRSQCDDCGSEALVLQMPNTHVKSLELGQACWLMPVVPATREAGAGLVIESLGPAPWVAGYPV